MSEQRTEYRDADVCIGVSCFAILPDGNSLEGVVKDVSDGGARISGSTEGMSIGQEIDLHLAVRGEKIGYVGAVVYVSAEDKVYGIKFKAGPTALQDGPAKAKRCIKCQRWYDASLSFCGTCGSDLTQPRSF